MAVRLVVRRAGSPAARDGNDGAHYEFEQTRLVIGRSPSADLRLPALTVSDLHATLEQTERGHTLCDMRSTNGTRVNGTALVPERARALHEGDRLEVGEFVIEFHTGGPVTGLTTPERTVSLAKRLLGEGRDGDARGQASLRWQWAGEPQGECPLPAPPARWLLGSAADANLRVPSPDAPEAMLELSATLDGLRVRPVDGQTLTVNGKPTRGRLLRDGDHACCGLAELFWEDPAERALRALEGQADTRFEPTAQARAQTAGDVPLPSAQADAPTKAPAPPADAESKAPTAPKTSGRPSVGPDAVVYALALLVLAASAVGMLWLLGD